MYADTMGDVFSTFINQAVQDESTTSPNYTYILFESIALSLKLMKHNTQAFQTVENKIIGPLLQIIERNLTDLTSFSF
jgi:hypothetical protein